MLAPNPQSSGEIWELSLTKCGLFIELTGTSSKEATYVTGWHTAISSICLQRVKEKETFNHRAGFLNSVMHLTW